MGGRGRRPSSYGPCAYSGHQCGIGSGSQHLPLLPDGGKPLLGPCPPKFGLVPFDDDVAKHSLARDRGELGVSLCVRDLRASEALLCVYISRCVWSVEGALMTMIHER